MKNSALVLATIMLFPAFSWAAIEDHGDYTLDTDTGYRWLDTTLTRGRTASEVDAEISPTGEFAGCRFPRLFEVSAVVRNLGLLVNCGPGRSDCANPDGVEEAIRLLGDTRDARLDETNSAKDVAPDGAGYTRAVWNLSGDFLYIFDDELVDRATGVPVQDGTDYVDSNDKYLTDNGALNQGVLLICDTWPNSPLESKLVNFENVVAGTTEPIVSKGYKVTGDATTVVQDGSIVVETTPCTNCDGLTDYTTSQTITRANGLPFAFFGIDDFTFGSIQPLGNCYYNRDDVSVAYDDCGIYGTTTWGEKVLFQRGSTNTYPTSYGEGYPVGTGPWLNLESLTVQLRGVPTFTPSQGCIAPCKFSIDNLEINDAAVVEIDFDPWNAGNVINPTLDYFITVQITTTPDFSGVDVDPASVRLGPNNAPLAAAVITGNHDGDADTDYIFGFKMQDTGISCVHNRIILTGQTFDGVPFAAADNVVMHADCFETETVDLDVAPYDPDNNISPDNDNAIQVMLKMMNDDYGDPIFFNPSRATDVRIGPNRASRISSVRQSEYYKGGYDYLKTFRMEDTGITCDDTEVEVVGLNFSNFESGAPAFKVIAPIDPDCNTQCHP
jgi:hypothetical protein